jgi:hypothetical protein
MLDIGKADFIKGAIKPIDVFDFLCLEMLCPPFANKLRVRSPLQSLTADLRREEQQFIES